MNEQQLRRLSDCEVMMSKYHDKLNQYIAQSDHYCKSVVMNDDYRKSWEEFNQRIARDFGMIRKDIQALIQENKILSDKINFNYTEHDHLLKAQYEEMQKQKFHVEQLQKDSNISQINHEYHKKDLSSLKAKTSECEKVYPEINKYKEEIFKLSSVFDTTYKQLSKRIDDLNNLYAEQRTFDASLRSWLEKVDKDHVEGYSKIEKKFEGHRQDTLSLLNSATGQLQQKMDNLPKPCPPPIPQIDISPQLEAFKKELQENFGSSLLDVSNAKTKSDVNEMQLKIMNKKLENIYLLLKKHDLTK